MRRIIFSIFCALFGMFLVLPPAVALTDAEFDGAVNKLKSKDVQERRAAISVIAQSNDSKANKYIIKALKDNEATVRMTAVDFLRKRKGPAVVDALCGVVAEDKNPQVRHSAVRALQNIKDPAAVPSLIKALEDEDNAVKYQVPIALGMLRAGDSVDKLNTLVNNNEDKTMSVQVIKGLSLIKDKRSVPFIEEALHDPEKKVKISAVRALAKMRNEDSIPKMKVLLGIRDDTVKLAAAESLSLMRNTGGLKVCLGLLNSSDKTIRKRAVVLLGAIGGKKHISTLKKLEEAEDLKSEIESSIQKINNRHPKKKK